jgi:hypothetical protein
MMHCWRRDFLKQETEALLELNTNLIGGIRPWWTPQAQAAKHLKQLKAQEMERFFPWWNWSKRKATF